MHVLPWFELLPSVLQEATMPAAATERAVVGRPAWATPHASVPGTWFRDVLVHDEQPSPTFVTNSDARPGTDS